MLDAGGPPCFQRHDPFHMLKPMCQDPPHVQPSAVPGPVETDEHRLKPWQVSLEDFMAGCQRLKGPAKSDSAKGRY